MCNLISPVIALSKRSCKTNHTDALLGWCESQFFDSMECGGRHNDVLLSCNRETLSTLQGTVLVEEVRCIRSFLLFCGSGV
jgi:hypothetical protein